jgi:inactivated superfamily I helicase
MRVFSVPVSVPFLRAVIAALIDGRLVDGFEARSAPARLADATLYLPTRRAMRLAREVFLDELNTDGAILPRIVALGDIDEDELAFADEADAFAEPLDIPPKLSELDRRLTLAKLVAAWAKGPVLAPLVVGGPASTLALAGDLARLMDDMVTRDVAWDALDGLVPDQLDQYWKHSLDRLDAGDREIPPRGGAAAARRRGAAGARHRSRRRGMAEHRRRQERGRKVHHASRLEPSAIRDACAARPVRPHAPRCPNPATLHAAWPRHAAVRDDAPLQRDRAMA